MARLGVPPPPVWRRVILEPRLSLGVAKQLGPDGPGRGEAGAGGCPLRLSVRHAARHLRSGGAPREGGLGGKERGEKAGLVKNEFGTDQLLCSNACSLISL